MDAITLLAYFTLLSLTFSGVAMICSVLAYIYSRPLSGPVVEESEDDKLRRKVLEERAMEAEARFIEETRDYDSIKKTFDRLM